MPSSPQALWRGFVIGCGALFFDSFMEKDRRTSPGTLAQAADRISILEVTPIMRGNREETLSTRSQLWLY